MTPAHLKTLRESLGISAQWLADQAGVQRRTVQHWESGRSTVPADVAAMIERLDADFERMSDAAVEQAKAAKAEHGAPESVDLVRYRTDAALWAAHPEMKPLPVTAHAALLYRCMRKLEAAGFAVTIDFP